MSEYPQNLDTDVDLPRVDDNITTIGADAINALRASVFAIEAALGINPQGSTPSTANRLATSLDPNGNILPSAIAAAGLVSLPITNSEVSASAGITENKLALTYPTATLYNLYLSLNGSIGILNGWLSTIGIMVLPHINGSAYNHELSAILVDETLPMLKTNPQPLTPSAGTNVVSRNTTNADTLISDISNDLTVHEKADGSANVSQSSGGTVPPLNFAHNSTGLYLDPDNFSTIPATIDTVQLFAEYVDQSSLLLLGSRVQTLYSNGIPRTARSSSLINDGYGGPLVPPTPVIAYLLGVPPGPISSTPVDNYNDGDDIISFVVPAAASPYTFDSQFALVQPGDIITINYNNGTAISYQFVIDSIKAKISGTTRTYSVRINGKNLFSTPIGGYGSARIDRSLFNREKYGVLAPAVAPTPTSGYESLIIANPRSAVALGNGFNASEFDASHYNLYLVLYPNGNPNGPPAPIQMPAIDVTGNLGATPGKYTLDSIVLATNTAFRQPGFNYRFIAFEYNGQFGIMLADPYNNASFSIIGGSAVDTNGSYTYGGGTSNATATNCPNNVVDNGDPTYNTTDLLDPLGFGITAANIATPPPTSIFTGGYVSAISANIAPLLVFYPLSKNYFYTNGAERDRLRSDPNFFFQNIDVYGDGYWDGYIVSKTTYTGPNRLQVAYQIDLDLASTGLAIGKTLVVQQASGTNNYFDYGRFVISNVQFYNCNTSNAYTIITVYDAVHAVGSSPAATSNVGTPVFIYFSDDSVSFDAENVADSSSSSPYRRYFEIFVDQNGHTFSHERARFPGTASGTGSIEFVSVSPKLRGYPGVVNEGTTIRLSVSSFVSSTGIYVAQLGKWNGSLLTNLGPLTTGKQGEVVRVYDESNIDYIDFEFPYTASMPSTGHIDIQLFPSLQLDEELMCISTCMIDDNTASIALLEDNRQFGNVSEEQLSSSALAYIAASDRELRENGIIQGFDLVNQALIDGATHQEGAINSVTDGVVTATNLVGIISGNVGEYITISNAVIPGNNGTFLISATNPSTSLSYINPNGVSPDPNNGSIYWSITSNCNVSINGGSALINGSITNINNASIEMPVLFEHLSTGASIDNITWFLCASNSGELQLVASTDFDPSGSFSAQYNAAGVDQDRLFTAINPNNTGAGTYTIRGTYLSNLVLNYKDLTPLYVITANVGLNNASAPYVINGYSISDARRYMSNGFNGLDNALVLGVDANFRSIEALDTWLQQMTRYISATNNKNAIGTNVIVKGPWIINTSIFLDYAKSITFTGDDATFIFQANMNGSMPISGTIEIGSNVSFINITFDNQFDPTEVFSGSYGPDSNYSAGVLSNNLEACIYVNVETTNNISINDCDFVCPNQHRFPFIVFSFAGRSSTANNINISHNTINTTFATADDLLSFITFTATAGSPISTPLTGTFLIDCIIDDNICNKNQLISISGTPNGSGIIFDLITAVNCRISNNVCGAINYMVKTAPIYNYQNGSTYANNLSSDKDNGLTISNNTCRLIYTGADTGAIGTVISTVFTYYCNILNANITPGSADVIDNTISWIHTKIPSLNTAKLDISDNTLRAFDVAYLVPYYGNTANALNAAIHLISTIVISGSTINITNANAFIANNFIASSTSTSNNSTTVPYNYFQCIVADGYYATAINNMMSGIASTTTSGINTITNTGNTAFIQMNGQAIVKATGNTMIRGTKTITAYVYNNTSQRQIVVDNVFDSTTVDGAATVLDFGTLAGSTYSRNINQSAFLSISLMDYARYMAGGTGIYSTPTFPNSDLTGPTFPQWTSVIDKTVPNPTTSDSAFAINRISDGTSAGSEYTWIQLKTYDMNAPNGVQVGFTIPLDYVLPTDVKIVAVILGAGLNEIGAATLNQTGGQTANQISLNLVQYAPTRNVSDVLANVEMIFNIPVDTSIANIDSYTLIVYNANAGDNGPGYAIIKESDITGSTQYCTISPTPGSLITGPGGQYKIAVEVNMNFAATGSTLDLPQSINWFLSPIVVRYQW